MVDDYQISRDVVTNPVGSYRATAGTALAKGRANATMELNEALRPITSLISKSEKARQKLAPGTWQHTMLQGNLKALHLAMALMAKEMDSAENLQRGDLPDALRAFASMISRAEEARGKFKPGTSQHTLQQNRIEALRVAEALIREKAAEW